MSKTQKLIPKFIVALANSSNDTDWIVHTEYPRFIAANVSDQDDGVIETFEVVEWFDEPATHEKLAKLLRMAGEAFGRECQKIDSEIT